MTDTIIAPITAPGHAGVSVIRISGARTEEITAALVPDFQGCIDRPRSLRLLEVTDPQKSGEALDSALVVYFPKGESFTGESSAELHLHGSPYLVNRVISAALEIGARMARPGEFSERAFLNGVMDLAQAEAVADLINAETEAQARVAKQQLDGKLSTAIANVGEPLRDMLSEIEANIDFPEEDIDPSSYSAWNTTTASVLDELSSYINSFRQGRLMREGISVAIVGLPNSGKSSLLNALLQEDRAIVTDIAGTTRDTIEEHVSIQGIKVRFIDTAGLLDSESTTHKPEKVEQLGIERSWNKISEADLVLFLFDGTMPLPEKLLSGITEKARRLLLVLNKADLLSTTEYSKKVEELSLQLKLDVLAISALKKSGVEEIQTAIVNSLIIDSREQGTVLVTTERHVESLKHAYRALERASVGITERVSPEFIAADIRESLSSLTEIIGATPTEEILGRIFSKFCIGK